MTSRSEAQMQGHARAEPILRRRRSSSDGLTESLGAVTAVEAIEFEGRLLLISPDRQALFMLNESARIVWETMKAGVGAEDMAALLAEGYGLPVATARAGVEGFLRRWRAEGLVESAPAADQPLPRSAISPSPRSGPRLRSEFRVEHVYAFCGTTFCLRFDETDLGSWMHQLLAHCEMPEADPRHALDVVRCGADYILLRDGLEIRRHASAQAAAGAVIGAVCDLSYPGADWLLFMHAAAVASDDGAVVMIGPNGSGKSTLTAALIRSGLDYFADDVVPLDGRTMQIMPVPFAISLKEGSWPVLAALYPALQVLPVHRSGGRRMRHLAPPREHRVQRTGAAVKSLVFPCFQPDQPTALNRLSPLEVLVRLIDGRCPIALDKERLRRTLDWIKTVPSYELRHHNLQEATAEISSLLRDSNVSPARDVPISASGTGDECERLNNAISNGGHDDGRIAPHDQ